MSLLAKWCWFACLCFRRSNTQLHFGFLHMGFWLRAFSSLPLHSPSPSSRSCWLSSADFHFCFGRSNPQMQFMYLFSLLMGFLNLGFCVLSPLPAILKACIKVGLKKDMSTSAEIVDQINLIHHEFCSYNFIKVLDCKNIWLTRPLCVYLWGRGETMMIMTANCINQQVPCLAALTFFCLYKLKIDPRVRAIYNLGDATSV